MKSLRITLFIACMGVSLSGQPKDIFAPEPPKKPDITETAPGVFQVGTVKLVKAEKEISFPATVNMHEGPMEYLVVTGKGKTHESLLVTSAEPFHVQVAMLLLNCKGSDGRLIPEIDTKPVPGEKVAIEFHWETDKKPMKMAIEKFVQRVDKKPMGNEPFVFNGSRMFEGSFLAQRDGSIVSLITDNAAQFNNARQGRADDELWRPQPKGLPALDSNGTVVIRVLQNVKKSKDAH
jgi:hypothetical protein